MTAISAISAPESVTRALSAASSQTGVGFEYLMQTAMRESGLDSTANAATSSAVGLFQFIEGTWMQTLKESGSRHGLNEIAAAINKNPSGRYEVADPDTRAAILALRTDPAASALMAAELAKSNAETLHTDLGRPATGGELYVAHFLGAGGASQLISAATQQPDMIASQLFPRAAKANPSIFYSRGGKARTVVQVYANLVARHGRSSVTKGASRPLDITPDLARAGKAPRVDASSAVAAAGAREPAIEAAATAYAPEQRPLHNLYAPVFGPGANPETLLASVRAYGGANNVQPAPVTHFGDPERLISRSSGLWGGGLFTTAPARPISDAGGLFTSIPEQQ